MKEWKRDKTVGAVICGGRNLKRKQCIHMKLKSFFVYRESRDSKEEDKKDKEGRQNQTKMFNGGKVIFW